MTTATTRRGGRAEVRRVDALGLVTLSQGKPVAGAQVRLLCGTEDRSARTDERGRFTLRGVVEGDCLLTLPGTSLTRSVRVSGNLLRQGDQASAPQITVALAPVHRLKLSWSVPGCGGTDCSGTLTLDERIHEEVLAGEHRLALRGGALLLDGARIATAGGLEAGKVLESDRVKLTVLEHRAADWLPLGLRGSPHGGELVELPVRSADGALVRFGKLLGKRTVVVVASCDAIRDEWRTDLAGLAESYDSIGLKANAVAVEPCTEARRQRGLVFAGPELLWAVGAAAGQVLVLGETGELLHRASVQRTRLLEATVSHLEQAWPSFAALQRVTLQKGESVSQAEAERLLAHAETQAKAGRHDEVHRLLRRVLALVPDSVEAHRQLALTKAELGDLSGALNEVSWWRTSFGDVAAEELMDAVRRRAKVSTLR